MSVRWSLVQSCYELSDRFSCRRRIIWTLSTTDQIKGDSKTTLLYINNKQNVHNLMSYWAEVTWSFINVDMCEPIRAQITEFEWRQDVKWQDRKWTKWKNRQGTTWSSQCSHTKYKQLFVLQHACPSFSSFSWVKTQCNFQSFRWTCWVSLDSQNKTQLKMLFWLSVVNFNIANV